MLHYVITELVQYIWDMWSNHLDPWNSISIWTWL